MASSHGSAARIPNPTTQIKCWSENRQPMAFAIGLPSWTDQQPPMGAWRGIKPSGRSQWWRRAFSLRSESGHRLGALALIDTLPPTHVRSAARGQEVQPGGLNVRQEVRASVQEPPSPLWQRADDD
jgi:hypothetical protein